MMLSNKKIVIIGGTVGMGFSAAKAFLSAGAKLVLVGRDDGAINEIKDQTGDAVAIMAGDATHADTASKAIALCMEKYGDFDGLYHVAGGSGRKFGDGPLHEITQEGWQHTIDLNLTSVMYSNQAAVKKFLDLKHGGTILNMGSILAISPSPVFFATHAYAAAKAGIIGFSKSIAAYYAKENIRVNVVAPSLVATPMSQRASTNEEIMSFIKQKQPLDGGRIGLPEDLDGIATYFMSDASKFVTAQVVAIDGGWSSGAY